jgi:hypothetical protein
MGKGWAWDWLVVRLSLVVMHLMCGYGGGGIMDVFGNLWILNVGGNKVKIRKN